MNTQTSPKDKQILASEVLQFWLEEYKALSSDIQNRVALQHGLLNFQILVMTASLAFYTGLKGANNQNPLDLVMLFLPVLFAYFHLRHSNHDINIIDKARYIHHVIRPEVSLLTKDKHVLGFETHLHNRRTTRASLFGTLSFLGNEHAFSIFMSFATLLLAYYCFFQQWDIVPASNIKEAMQSLPYLTLLIAGNITLALAMALRIRVIRGYSTLTSNC